MTEIDTKNTYSQLGLSKPKEDPNKSKDELGQSEFLKLMTTQLRNQDPLKPMENGDFLAQMAQFGTVSGINELNSTFNSMAASFQSNQALQASTLVGRQVLVPSDQSALKTGSDLKGSIDLAQSASQVIVRISDADGQLVQRLDLGQQQAGLVDFKWNGQNADGIQMAPGTYKIAAELHNGSEVTSGTTLSVVDVESVTIGTAGKDLTLTVSALGDIDMSQIRKIL